MVSKEDGRRVVSKEEGRERWSVKKKVEKGGQ